MRERTFGTLHLSSHRAALSERLLLGIGMCRIEVRQVGVIYARNCNCLAWIFGAASSSLFASQTVMAMYSTYHPHFTPQRWQMFICFPVVTWLDLSLVLFGQRFLTKAATAMGIMLMLILLVTLRACAVLPGQTGAGYASNTSVWTWWQNRTGWSSNGLVFVIGILNEVYAVGMHDGVYHLCEDIPNLRKNIPHGTVAQMITGSFTTFSYYVAVFHCVTDLTAVFNIIVTALTLAAMHQQATRSNGCTLGLLFIILLDRSLNIPDGYVTCGRMLWTLVRDDSTPFSWWLRHLSPR